MIRPLAQELPNATGAAKKREEREKKEKTKIEKHKLRFPKGWEQNMPWGSHQDNERVIKDQRMKPKRLFLGDGAGGSRTEPPVMSYHHQGHEEQKDFDAGHIGKMPPKCSSARLSPFPLPHLRGSPGQSARREVSLSKCLPHTPA